MKLLFDQNISFRIVKLLENSFPSSKQVRELRLENSSDVENFDFANSNSFSVVTFDADFIDLSLIKGTPPKIIRIRTGNLSTQNLSEILLQNEELIKAFLGSEPNEGAILEILKGDR